MLDSCALIAVAYLTSDCVHLVSYMTFVINAVSIAMKDIAGTSTTSDENYLVLSSKRRLMERILLVLRIAMYC